MLGRNGIPDPTQPALIRDGFDRVFNGKVQKFQTHLESLDILMSNGDFENRGNVYRV